MHICLLIKFYNKRMLVFAILKLSIVNFSKFLLSKFDIMLNCVVILAKIIVYEN